MPLSDAAIRSAKPTDKPYKLPDEKGLFLLVHPNGSRYWRHKYRFNGKEKVLAHGVYPEVGLKEARQARDDARKLLAQGIDPGEQRKAMKHARQDLAANSFEVIAREWFAKHRPTWAPNHASKILGRLENDVFPWIGSKPISTITPPQVLEVLRRVEARGVLHTAHRIKGVIGQVMRYAVATGRAERDPTADLKGALPPARGTHFPSITDPAKVAELLRAFDAFTGTHTVRAALLLAPLLFVRPGELRSAKWEQFDLEQGEWKYFVTKTKTEHVVPLSTQALAILRDLYPLTGSREYVFPGRDPKKPMSDAAINAALKRMGFDTQTEITGHGFRAMARTLLAEELHQRPEVIEHQLAHKVPDALGNAYNRTKFLRERTTMMQMWADYLDKLKAGAEVIPMPTAA